MNNLPHCSGAALRVLSLAVLLISIGICPHAQADVFGRLSIRVRNVNDREPVPHAQVVLHDSAQIRPDLLLTTDEHGRVTSPLLENRNWQVSIIAENFLPQQREIRVPSDRLSTLDLDIEPTQTTIKISGSQSTLQPQETSNSAIRTIDFVQRFPISSQNTQQLTGMLTSNPGFVENSANQVHPRGEHSATSIYIQGFQLGGAAQGRFGPLINPDALESVEVMTGGFSAEYAGGAAILNSSIRSGSAKPFAAVELGTGSYDTGNADFSLGGQAGTPIGAPGPDGVQSKILSWFLTGSLRSTDNALEAPQPDAQSAHNHGTSQTFAGRFDLNPSSADQYSLIVGSSPAQTQVANRTGLSERYAEVGQGYGFGGALSAADAQSAGIQTQDQLGQDIYQRDRNSFAVAQWRHDISHDLSSLVSIGVDETRLDTLNSNPMVQLDQLANDSSIEYNPEVARRATHQQLSASITRDLARHSIKFGGQYVNESADDSYELTPASQLAANALYAADPRLAPRGELLFDSAGNPLLDRNGNQVFQLATGANAQRLSVESDGYFAATYLQDTWRLSDSFTANFGGRYDRYVQNQNLEGRDVTADQFSPRVNLSWAFLPGWIARSSYNRLLIVPPVAQGSVIGDAIKPERVNQYEASLEREIAPRQKIKTSYYLKQIRNQVDTGLLIPETQMGLFTSVNLDRARVHGIEFSYDLLPEHGHGIGAYAAYAYSVAKPSGFDNTGEAVEKYNDHDQRHTLSTGLSYTFSNDASVGTAVYYGSGVASSVLTEDGSRDSRSRVNLSLSSPPKMLFGHGALKLTASNLFDDRSVINFNSPFSGTRFQQAQSFLLSAEFRF